MSYLQLRLFHKHGTETKQQSFDFPTIEFGILQQLFMSCATNTSFTDVQLWLVGQGEEYALLVDKAMYDAAASEMRGHMFKQKLQ